MNNSNNIKIALVGCGRISSTHFESIKGIDDFELTYVCDIDPDRAREVAETHSCKSATDYIDIPLDEVDVVAICTPNYLHFEMADYFLSNHKNILLEKPITLDVQEGARLISRAKYNNKHFFAVKQVRFNPAVRALKTVVAEGNLGKPLSCNLTIHWYRPQEYFDQGGWRGKKALDGGTLINQGIHYIDLLVWIFGPVKSVYAVIDTLNHDIEVEDHASAILRFANGAVGTLEFNVNTYPRNLECSLFMQGTEGSVKIGGPAMNELEMWEVSNIPTPNLSEGYAPNIYAKGLYQGSCPNHPYVYENVRDVLLGKSRKVATDGEAALETLKVIEAIYVSAESGEEVNIS